MSAYSFDELKFTSAGKKRLEKKEKIMRKTPEMTSEVWIEKKSYGKGSRPDVFSCE